MSLHVPLYLYIWTIYLVNMLFVIPIFQNLLDTNLDLKSPAVWAYLGVYPLDMPRTPYRASEGKRSQ